MTNVNESTAGALDVVVGIDIGGTKTQLLYAGLDGATVADIVVPTIEWDPEEIETASGWILDQALRNKPVSSTLTALGVGAMGLDTDEICAEYEAHLNQNGAIAAKAVNDAGLLLPAAGLETGIAVISGTGAIGLARQEDGSYLYAGGWGWVLGDEGGASALVREATIAVLKNVDRGGPHDVLADALMEAFAVRDTQKLTRAVNDEPTYTNWAPKAHAVFDAAKSGSPIALAVIETAGADLAELIEILISRGADGSNVIAAGSVITNQPLLFDAFRSAVAIHSPSSVVRLLDRPPAAGGVQIALDALRAAGQ